MKVFLNDTEIELEDYSNLYSLLKQSKFIKPNIAVAVNNNVIQKTKWDSYCLNDKDRIVIINAIFGG